MSANATPPKASPPASRWRLWVDGCGGFLLLCGDHWTVGGPSDRATVDVCVRADWPRLAGVIERQGGDYFWSDGRSAGARKLIMRGEVLPIAGSAVVSLQQPSPLSASAVLTLRPPHRFEGHVDGVILVSETFLLGPSADNHIRCPLLSDRAVVVRRGDRWLAKAGLGGDLQELVPAERMTLGDLAMTLEEA